jgi:hypothetical protein
MLKSDGDPALRCPLSGALNRVPYVLILGWVGCILLRYNEMGDFCCTINATYIFVISYYTFSQHVSAIT